MTTLSITTRPAQPELPYPRTSAMQKATMAPTVEIVKYQPPKPAPDVDAFILSLWLMYCRAPRKETPEVDGSYSLGEIGADAEKTWSRLTPYSIARREP